MTDPRFLTSVHHPLVKHLVKLRINSFYRKEQQALVLEGLKPILEVATHVKRIFYTSSYASYISVLPGEKWKITEAILQKISGVVSPEGMIAEIQMPSFLTLDKSCQVLALDGISDPGNMGTILRTALALGWQAIYFLPGGCDPFNEKTLRAARGAHFNLVLSKGTAEQLQHWVKMEKIQPLAANLKGIKPEDVTFASRRLLVLGNEAHGVSKMVQQFCKPVTIPMCGRMESLNVAVAGGILLYLLSNFRMSL